MACQILIACQIYCRKDNSLFSSRMYRLYEKGDMDGLTLWPFRMRPGRPGSRRRRRCHCCHPIQNQGRHRGLAPGRSHRKGRPRPLLTAGSDETTSLPSFSIHWHLVQWKSWARRIPGSHACGKINTRVNIRSSLNYCAHLTQSKQYLASTLCTANCFLTFEKMLTCSNEMLAHSEHHVSFLLRLPNSFGISIVGCLLLTAYQVWSVPLP